MNILVTFTDGTTEMRPANCPVGTGSASWIPGGDIGLVGKMLRIDLPDGREAFAWRLDYAREAWGDVSVWCIVGQDPITKALTGQWRQCRPETVNEQIDRLTRERDDARRVAVLGRMPWTAARKAEKLVLVDAAKREGWL